jgi:plasmid stabilization system protein ParE
MQRFKVVFSPESLGEIEQVVNYYKQISKELGEKFKAGLLKEITAIRHNPFTGSIRYENVRFAVVKKFPYAIHYTVEEKSRLIKIQAVLGFSQNDEKNWRKRF